MVYRRQRKVMEVLISVELHYHVLKERGALQWLGTLERQGVRVGVPVKKH